MRRVSLVFGMVALLAVGCDRGSHPKQLGKAAPGFTVSDGTETVDLQKLRGKVVLLNFWATWCGPCIQEVPSLNQLQEQMPGLAIVGVSTDEDDPVYRSFLVDHHIVYKTVRDGQQKVNALYGSFQYPETYVIDRQGVLRRKFIGQQNWTSSEIENYLKTL